MKSTPRLILPALLLLASSMPALAAGPAPAAAPASAAYDDMQGLFRQWRMFARPQPVDAAALSYAPDAIAARQRGLQDFMARLQALDRRDLSVRQRNDYRIFMAELNGMKFELETLRPWQRDPNYYVTVWPTRTDVPLREAPTPPLEIQLYRYRYPLSAQDQAELQRQLQLIPGFYQRAPSYLTGNAHDLWLFGIQGLREQREALAGLLAGTLRVSDIDTSGTAGLQGCRPELVQAAKQALQATDALIAWLQREAPKKTGPSGVGKERYSWYQQNAHLVPYTWDQEVALMKRELARARASLLLEEQHNAGLRAQQPVGDQAQLTALYKRRLDHFLQFLGSRGVLTMQDFIPGVLAAKQPHFVPEGQRRFFDQVNLRDPSPLISHEFHWIELARDRTRRSGDVFRDTPLLYSIFDNRAEGFATAFEEILLHAGLYDDAPRSRELVWIMLANRAARGLASLYVQANMIDLEAAGHFHAENTPRGWAIAGDELTAFEQLLYLRQPGYGTSYVTGKIMVDEAIERYGRQALCGKDFRFADFMDWFQGEGIVPVTLILDEVPQCAAPAPR